MDYDITEMNLKSFSLLGMKDSLQRFTCLNLLSTFKFDYENM